VSQFGNWLYYRRKFKLFVLPGFGSRQSNKNILALTYERNWELPDGWHANYFDIHSPFTFITSPGLIIEREFNDGKAVYDWLYKRVFRKKTLKAFWFIDAHVSDKERMSYCNNFDFVFVAHSPYIDIVKKNTACKNIFWLPLCYPGMPGDIQQNIATSRYPVSFIGRFGNGFEARNEMINFLRKEYNGNFFTTTDFINSKKLIQESAVTTNCSIKDDLNFRVFETLGYGTELVTNHVSDLDKIEGLKDKLYYFHNLNELKGQVDQVINDSAVKHDMPEIQQWIRERHTMKSRLAEMLEMIDTGKQLEYK
jgi:hypothetical protein